MRYLTALVGLLTLSCVATLGVTLSASAPAAEAGSPGLAAVPGSDIDQMLPADYRNPRSAQAAVRWALGQVGVVRDNGYCLRFVNLAYGRASGPPSAYLVWTRSHPGLHHTRGTPPAGAVVVWSSAIGGGHGHIAISLGDGRMVTTTDGPVSIRRIQGFADSAYLGWMPPYFYM